MNSISATLTLYFINALYFEFIQLIFICFKMSTKDSVCGKILVCLCCSHTACQVGACYNCWTGCESYGLCALNCQGCCWSLCAPICHQCKMGDTTEAGDKLSKALRYCAFCCLL